MGRYLAFWASVPWVMMGSQHRPLWVATMSPVEAHCLDSSSMQMALARGSAPAPPYSLGTHMPITPRSNSFSMFSRGYWLVLSVSAAMGFTSFSVNSAIIFRTSWCSRLRLKSMMSSPYIQIWKTQRCMKYSGRFAYEILFCTNSLRAKHLCPPGRHVRCANVRGKPAMRRQRQSKRAGFEAAARLAARQGPGIAMPQQWDLSSGCRRSPWPSASWPGGCPGGRS